MTHAKCYACNKPAQYAAGYIKIKDAGRRNAWAADEIEFQCAEHKRYERPLQMYPSTCWNNTFENCTRFAHMFKVPNA